MENSSWRRRILLQICDTGKYTPGLGFYFMCCLTPPEWEEFARDHDFRCAVGVTHLVSPRGERECGPQWGSFLMRNVSPREDKGRFDVVALSWWSGCVRGEPSLRFSAEKFHSGIIKLIYYSGAVTDPRHQAVIRACTDLQSFCCLVANRQLLPPS